MKFLDEYRDSAKVKALARRIRRTIKRPWSIMEICGGQTHAILRFGLDELLPKNLTLVHGPGCPVCVTPVEIIDKAIEIAEEPGVIFCSFGDMLRVPGSARDLFWAKAKGADVRIVYSPMDALELARLTPDRQVVFFAVGFETTAPANAMTVYQAKLLGIKNFSILISHVLVPPAMEAILASPDNQVKGFLAAGHVCTVMGTAEYTPIARKYRVPIVVTGFEPVDILQGILMCVEQLECGRCEVQNQYARSVRSAGNATAIKLIRRVFRTVPRNWRGIGRIAKSGFGLAPAYKKYDAQTRFGRVGAAKEDGGECLSGVILRGLKKPFECPAFGIRCNPEHPLGATMVSSEGACAAYYRYRKQAS
ncbi:MAG: hydrogenase formation protein HypD [Candidatus Omnitrophota bacterium]